MKRLFILIVVFMTLITGDTVMGDNTTESNQKDQTDIHVLTDDFLSGKGVVWRKALNELEKRKEATIIAKGLQHENIAVRLAAVEVLERLDDASVLRALLDALRAHNFVAEGSSDTVTPHNTLKVKLVKLIEKISGRQFGITDYDDVSHVEQLIDEMELFLKNEKQK